MKSFGNHVSSVFSYRMSEEVLKDGMTVEVAKDGGKIELPKGFCPSSHKGKEGCNRTFSITAVEWPGITHVRHFGGIFQNSFHVYITALTQPYFLQVWSVNIIYFSYTLINVHISQRSSNKSFINFLLI